MMGNFQLHLLAREGNYSSIERECLALILAIKIFEMYLW